ncbi:uncharacterized protein METZ01_LOCUS465047, partial [marine metagenome]
FCPLKLLILTRMIYIFHQSKFGKLLLATQFIQN